MPLDSKCVVAVSPTREVADGVKSPELCGILAQAIQALLGAVLAYARPALVRPPAVDAETVWN